MEEEKSGESPNAGSVLLPVKCSATAYIWRSLASGCSLSVYLM